MKLKTKIITGTVALIFLPFGAGGLQAQVINTMTITATASVQNNTSDNGTVSTTPVPTKYSFDTKQVLAALALAENLEGKYPTGTTFPSGAKLVAVVTTGSGNGPDFQVLNKNNNLLVDVSDILSAGSLGSYVFSGKQNDTTGLASPTVTSLQIYTIYYDDTSIPGSSNIQFYFGGFLTSTFTDTVPNINTGAYTETQSYTIPAAVGDGYANGNPAVIKGSVTASGKGAITP